MLRIPDGIPDFIKISLKYLNITTGGILTRNPLNSKPRHTFMYGQSRLAFVFTTVTFVIT